ncbi:MAG: hypothetical protein IIC73_00020 [Armatimonadetes bacterium]|nr:hypothetical protein [Armatimonadota bacterium]
MELKRQVTRSAGIIVVSTVVVFIVFSLLPKTYQSKHVLYFPLSQAGGGLQIRSFLGGSVEGGDALGPGIVRDPLSPLVGSSPSTASGILKSRTCMRTVVQALSLDEKWGSSEEEAILTLRGDISTKMDASGFLVVSAKSEDPELCVEILNAMHQFLIERADVLTFNVSKQNREYIAERVRLSEESSDEAEASFIRTARENTVSDIGAVQGLYLALLSDVSRSRAEKEAAAIRIEQIEEMITRQIDGDEELAAQLNALQSIGGDPNSSLGAALSELSKELQQRQLALEDVSRKFTEASEEFRMAKEQVEASKKVASDIIDSAADSLEDGTLAAVAEANLSLASLTATIDAMESTLQGYAEMMDQTPAAQTAVTRVQKQFEAALARTETLRSALEMARIQEQNDPARFEIVDAAEPIQKPIAPRKAFLTGVWLLFVSACCGWWILRQRIQFVD